MKRFFLFSLVTMMFVATLTTSCSMQGMVFKNLEKKGYIVGRLTPAQQVAMAPLMQAFPALDLTAEAYLASEYSISYLYSATNATWMEYGAKLIRAGFSQVGKGYVKIDKTAGITYNVASSSAGEQYIVITFTSTVLQ
ncbi:MAG: hypothetical protein IKB11_00650 [Bacteroidaceae bacterium]|nr:hypothetical protein [Bacteroidaceae bacterium]